MEVGERAHAAHERANAAHERAHAAHERANAAHERANAAIEMARIADADFRAAISLWSVDLKKVSDNLENKVVAMSRDMERKCCLAVRDFLQNGVIIGEGVKFKHRSIDVEIDGIIAGELDGEDVVVLLETKTNVQPGAANNGTPPVERARFFQVAFILRHGFARIGARIQWLWGIRAFLKTVFFRRNSYKLGTPPTIQPTDWPTQVDMDNRMTSRAPISTTFRVSAYRDVTVSIAP
jgi:hypothetical protein